MNGFIESQVEFRRLSAKATLSPMFPLATLLLLAEVVLSYNPKGYEPSEVLCPSDANFVRPASQVSPAEKDWLEKRHAITDKALLEFLNRADLDSFYAEEFLSSLNRSINIGVAISGGGYRSMFNGAGQLAALDSRVEGSIKHGLGGLLQSTTYLVGLSGGNWLTGSLALTNWSTVPEILAAGDLWDLEHSIISPSGLDVVSSAERWHQINNDVAEKQRKGFDISITDLWGRALSYQFFGSKEDGGVALTYSGLQEFDAFKSAEMPMPISVAVGRTPGTLELNGDSTVYEFNPFEMGSWDPSLFSFTDLKYLGSRVSEGRPLSDVCIEGYDNAGFVLGISSSLFNAGLLNLNVTGLTGPLYDLAHGVLEFADDEHWDIAIVEPNPFRNSKNAGVKSIVDDERLYLSDGGLDHQNVPFAPLLQPERGVDVIFAFDNSYDTDDKFPDGEALKATYERQFGSQGNGTAFPHVPTIDTILHDKLNTKPMFLGCNASSLDDLATVPPLVVYLPNIAYSTWSNTSTAQIAYSDKQRNAVITNGFESATRYNLTIDPNWPKCVSCAIIHREQERKGIPQTDECAECFQEYCWSGEQYTGSQVVLPRSANWSQPSLVKREYNDEGDFIELNGTIVVNATANSTGVNVSNLSIPSISSVYFNRAETWAPSSILVGAVAVVAGLLV